MDNAEIRSFLPDHVRAMDELEAAIASGEAATLQVAEQQFRSIRSPLIRWVTEMEVDAEIEGKTFTPEAEIQNVIERDAALLGQLKIIEQGQRQAFEQLLRTKAVERDKKTKKSLPRAIREKRLSRTLMGKAIDQLRLLHTFWKERNLRKCDLNEYYTALLPIIECALAFRNNPDDVTKTMRNARNLNIGLWQRIYKEFGAELCALATDYSDEARGRWMDLCERLGDAYISNETKEKVREIEQRLTQEEARSRRGRKGPRN